MKTNFKYLASAIILAALVMTAQAQKPADPKAKAEAKKEMHGAKAEEAKAKAEEMKEKGQEQKAEAEKEAKEAKEKAEKEKAASAASSK